MTSATSPTSRAARRAAPLWREGDDPRPLHELLSRGGVLGVPTESSYALAADPASEVGVAAIFRLKGRSPDKPLPVVVADAEALASLGIDPANPAVSWLVARWPAPLSGLLPISRPLPAAAGSGSLAVRVPALAPLRRLLAELGRALTATSANRGGEAPILSPRELARWLAREDAVVVDGGMLPGGPPSTLVAFEGSRLRVLRPGAFSGELAAELHG